MDRVNAVIQLWTGDKDSRQWPTLLGRRSATVESIAVSNDGKRLACLTHSASDVDVQLWDLPARKRLWTRRFPTTDKQLWLSPFRVESDSTVAFTPDGKELAFGMGKEVKVVSVASGKELPLVKSGKSAVLCVAINPNGTQLAYGGADGAIKVWDLRTRKEGLAWPAHGSPVACLAFSADGRFLASGAGPDWYSGEPKVWDAATGAKRATLMNHEGYYHKGVKVAAVAFSPDGKWLAAGNDNGIVQLWAVAKVVRRQQAESP